MSPQINKIPIFFSTMQACMFQCSEMTLTMFAIRFLAFTESSTNLTLQRFLLIWLLSLRGCRLRGILFILCRLGFNQNASIFRFVAFRIFRVDVQQTVKSCVQGSVSYVLQNPLCTAMTTISYDKEAVSYNLSPTGTR